MTPASHPAFEPIPIAMAALVALTLPLPLRWWTLGASALVLAALLVGGLRRTRGANATVAAIAALSIVDATMLGYAAFALLRPGAFGPMARLGYPLLVATGLRLEGGAWLVLLCGLVGLVPLVFNHPRHERKEREDRKD